MAEPIEKLDYFPQKTEVFGFCQKAIKEVFQNQKTKLQSQTIPLMERCAKGNITQRKVLHKILEKAKGFLPK